MEVIVLHLLHSMGKLIQNLAVIFSFSVLFLTRFKLYKIGGTASARLDLPGITFFSLLTIIAMVFPLEHSTNPKIVTDVRIAAIVLAGAYLGIRESILVGLISSLARYLIGGPVWVIWVPVSLFTGPATWFLLNKTPLKRNNRTIALAIIAVAVTIGSAALFVFSATHFGFLSQLAAHTTWEVLAQIYLPLLVFNPLAVVAVNWILKNVDHHYSRIRHLEIEARTDGMTGLYNHRSFQSSLVKCLKTAHLNRQPLSLLMIDFDHFKAYNDFLGHQKGDALLKDLGSILCQTVRNQDIVARYGGEEFAVILPNTPQETAIFIAEKIRVMVETSVLLPRGGKLPNTATVSIGVASYPLNAQTKKALIEKADKALYKAKNSGRNNVCCYKNV